MITTNIPTLQIHRLTEEQYEAAKLAGTLEENAIYMTPEAGIDLTGYATEDYVDAQINAIPEVDLTGYATITHVNTAISAIPTPTFSATDDGNGNVILVFKTIYAPGMYDASGAFTSWNDLVTSGSITLNNDGTIITDCDTSLIGKLVIPEGIIRIGSNAFSMCQNLTSVVIPEGVIGINDYAFSRCTGLTSITIPASVTYITSGAFYMVNTITDVYYAGTEEQWAAINIGADYNNILNKAIKHYNYKG